MKCALSLLLTAALVGFVASDTPTLYPASPFDPYSDAKTLYKAIDGWGTDEDAIISVLCHRVGTQRAQIANSYINQYGKVNDEMAVTGHSFDSDWIFQFEIVGLLGLI